MQPYESYSSLMLSACYTPKSC